MPRGADNGPGERRIRVLLVEDHAVVREGTKALMAQEHDIEVVGEADSVEGAVAAAMALQPDVIVLDVRLRGGSGVEVARRVREVAPDTGILVLTAYDNDQYIRSFMRVGVQGYLLKSASASEVNNAIRIIHQGGTVLAPEIATKVVAVLSSGGKQRTAVGEELTERELEILELLLTGARNAEIASHLGISGKAVEDHIAPIRTTLGGEPRPQAVRRAVREGLIQLPE